MKKNNVEKISGRELNWSVDLRGQNFDFQTTWGLFSPKRIDEGSKLLIEEIKIATSDRVLDVGCGYGPIGVVAGWLAQEGWVDMIDKDFVAVNYAKINLEKNNIKNGKVWLSNMLEQVPDDQMYDVVMSNLPAKVNKEMFMFMFEDINKHLKAGGRMYFVVIRGLKEFLKRSLKEYFGNSKRVAYSKNYVLFKAEKNS